MSMYVDVINQYLKAQFSSVFKKDHKKKNWNNIIKFSAK